MALKPWYKVVTPREDLREGKPLDASEFAVHLDKVRDGNAPPDYKDPVRFFERTYMTQNLIGLGGEVLRRLSGETTETSAIFNMTTQFGGGKTHALTMLYHLGMHGAGANAWAGVRSLLAKAEIETVPHAAVAVFVGTEFDSLTGRGGNDGTPLRKTPWGEIAFQLGGETAFKLVAEHDEKLIAPAGDVIRQFLPTDRPSLILMDEMMNYVSRNRKSGLSDQLYDFMQNLSETVRGETNAVLVVAVPKSNVIEMTADDEVDYNRFKHMLNRLGKAMIISVENEMAEIIRRRLFEWDPKAITQDGRVLLTKEAHDVCNAYGDWVTEHQSQVPNWFPSDKARAQFAATYPFHPMVLSVFERKWQTLPRFQKTRGMLRLLALWVSRAYQEGYKGAHKDQLIGLGTAPLDDPLFRIAAFEQLGGETVLESVVTTDICGKAESFATQLDKEAIEAIKQARLHRKVATSIFFESNGGVHRDEATIPEVRLAVAEPDLAIGNVETVLETLSDACYYLSVERNRYRFSTSPNLNKILADRLAGIQDPQIIEKVRTEIQRAFQGNTTVDKVYFPELSNQVTDRPVLTLGVLAPEHSVLESTGLAAFLETMTREYGNSARTFKSAVIWVVPESAQTLREEARRVLAWESIQDEAHELMLDESHKRQLAENLKKTQRDLKESVWRSYKNLYLLAKDNTMRKIDLGLVHSSAADNIVTFYLNRLKQDGDVSDTISPNFLTRNWPPVFSGKEWPTKAVRDAFFASPLFPKVLNVDIIKQTICRGVAEGFLAYVGKAPDGTYHPFAFKKELLPLNVEISDDVFIIEKLVAETYEELMKQPPKLTTLIISPDHVQIDSGKRQSFSVRGIDQNNREFPLTEYSWSATGGTIDESGVFLAGEHHGNFTVSVKSCGVVGQAICVIGKEPPPPPPPPPKEKNKIAWQGEVPAQKWMNFYTKVLSKHASSGGMKIMLHIEIAPEGGISPSQVEETKSALRELGLPDQVTTE